MKIKYAILGIFIMAFVVSAATTIKDTGTSTFGTNIFPATDLTYTLGNSTMRYSYAYMRKLHTFGGSGGGIIMDEEGNQDQGWLLMKFNDTYKKYLRVTNQNYFEILDADYSTALLSISEDGTSFSGDLMPQTDNANNLGNMTYAWKNVTAYAFTTKSSREVDLNMQDTYGKTAIDMIQDISVDKNGILEHDSIPPSYKTGDFWQTDVPTMVNSKVTYVSKSYENYNDIPPEDRKFATEHSTIDVNKRIDNLEAAVRELTAELCKYNSNYNFC